MTEAPCDDVRRVDRHFSARPRPNRRINAIYFKAVRLVTIRSAPSQPGKAASQDSTATAGISLFARGPLPLRAAGEEPDAALDFGVVIVRV